MPVLASLPYPSIAETMDLVRSLVLDTQAGATGTPGEGRTFTNDAPFTKPFLNQALRELQRKLENNNVGTFTVDNWILPGITPVPVVDPGLSAYISYTGYFDGTNQNQNPILPGNLLTVLDVWERPTGSTLQFCQMTQCDPLPSLLQCPFNSYWAYYTDQLNFPGSTQLLDFRLRYKAAVLAPINAAPADFATTFIQCIDSQDAIAYTMAYNYQNARGGGAGAQLTQDKNEAVRQMINRQVRAQQTGDFSRQPFGNSDNDFTGGNQQGW